jgi:two-component system osmolarity sensor histidine kinase EnvZ
VALTRSFNTMAEEISTLLANRTTLLAGVSHDLRTPLARMRLVLELMGDGVDGDLRARMVRNMDAMEALLSKGLKFARGWPRARPGRSSWGRTSRPGETQAQPLLSFENRLREPRTVKVAVEALDRVLENLMNNALAYSEAPVVLRLKESAKGLKVQVLDRGPGIPEGERQRVFQPFYRLEQSRSVATGGSGLGLAIVKQLCEAQGWRIEVTEHGGGGGAVFTVTLPLSRAGGLGGAPVRSGSEKWARGRPASSRVALMRAFMS